VPRGLYSLRDQDGTVVAYERFSCAPGPVGWRYNAQVLAPDGRTPTGLVDVTTDASGLQIRVEVRVGGWVVRGGVADGETVWARTGASGEDAGEGTAPAAGFTGRSPGFLVAVARLMGLRAGTSSRVTSCSPRPGSSSTRSTRHRRFRRGSRAEAGSHGRPKPTRSAHRQSHFGPATSPHRQSRATSGIERMFPADPWVPGADQP
jgi:hypothetical protein